MNDVTLPAEFVQGVYKLLLRVEPYGTLLGSKLSDDLSTVISQLNCGLLDLGIHPDVKG